MRVSRQWYNVARSTPILWSELHVKITMINNDKLSTIIAEIKEWLSRARSLPKALNLHLVGPDVSGDPAEYPSPQFLEIMDLFKSLCDQLQTFVFCIDTHPYFNIASLTPSTDLICWTKLQHFEIRIQNGFQEEYTFWLPRRTHLQEANLFPSLRTITLVSSLRLPELDLPWSNLTSIHVDSYGGTFSTGLRECVNLESLTIYVQEGARKTWKSLSESLERIVLPRLTSLQVFVYDWDYLTETWLLDHLDLPVLQTIRWGTRSMAVHPTLTSMKNMVERSGCSGSLTTFAFEAGEAVRPGVEIMSALFSVMRKLVCVMLRCIESVRTFVKFLPDGLRELNLQYLEPHRYGWLNNWRKWDAVNVLEYLGSQKKKLDVKLTFASHESTEKKVEKVVELCRALAREGGFALEINREELPEEPEYVTSDSE